MLNNYIELDNGVVRQLKIMDKKQVYDLDYIKKRYDSYKELSEKMSYLRLGYILGCVNKKIDSILDVGYGNGDFLRVASKIIPNCFGHEINTYPIPEKCKYVENIFDLEYDVACFFDVLEHFENIYDIENLKATYICISVPNCHYPSDEWFEKWKHRRPDEHLWHFNQKSLENFMKEIGYKMTNSTDMEDSIRIPQANLSNILTAMFMKKE